MNLKLAKKFRKAIGNITGVAKVYLRKEVGSTIIVDPNSNHGIYKRVKKAKLTRKHLNAGVDTTVNELLQEQA
jgi:hypothetical protein